MYISWVSARGNARVRCDVKVTLQRRYTMRMKSCAVYYSLDALYQWQSKLKVYGSCTYTRNYFFERYMEVIMVPCYTCVIKKEGEVNETDSEILVKTDGGSCMPFQRKMVDERNKTWNKSWLFYWSCPGTQGGGCWTVKERELCKTAYIALSGYNSASSSNIKLYFYVRIEILRFFLTSDDF